nr:MAG TPA: putative deoxyribose-phosphate aldolase [Bacteriophage sp.]
MDKGTIILSVPKGTTQEEIRAIRETYKDANTNVCIVVSGESSVKEVVLNLIRARINT